MTGERSMRFKELVGILWLGCGLLAMAINKVAEAAEAEKLNVCYSSIAATSITTWVPKEAGIYKKYGLDVSIIYVVGAQSITTLISGDTQIVQGSGAAAVLSRLSGSDVTMIGTTVNVIPMSLVTTPDVSGPQDLKGKTFGVSRFGSLTDLGLRKAVSEFGLDPNQRHQDDPNRRRSRKSAFHAAGCYQRRIDFVPDFGEGQRIGLQRIDQPSGDQVPLSGNGVGDNRCFHTKPAADCESIFKSDTRRNQIRHGESGLHHSDSRAVHAQLRHETARQRVQELRARLHPQRAEHYQRRDGVRARRRGRAQSKSQRRGPTAVLRSRAAGTAREGRFCKRALSAIAILQKARSKEQRNAFCASSFHAIFILSNSVILNFCAAPPGKIVNWCSVNSCS